LLKGAEYVLARWIVEKLSNNNIFITNTVSMDGRYVFSQRDINALRKAARENDIAIIPFTLVGHANLLFVNYEQNSVDHFEPHGSTYQGGGVLENPDIRTSALRLTEIIGILTYRKMNYHEPSYLCPTSRGPQYSEVKHYSEGQCVFWGLYLVEQVDAHGATRGLHDQQARHAARTNKVPVCTHVRPTYH
jgi:hypothetical protein